MKVNIKTFFYSQRLFCLRSSSFFSLLSLSLWSWSLSLLRHSLSSFWLSLSLWSWSRPAKCWDGGATRHGCVLRGHQLQEFVGFGGLVSVGFTGLIFFSLFLSPACFLSLSSFTPRGKPWDFGFGSEHKSKEMKFGYEENLEILGLGLSKNQKRWRWPEQWLPRKDGRSVGLWRCGECGVVDLWRMASRSMVVVGCGFVEVGCGFGIMEVGLCCGFASDEREEDRREEEIEKWTQKNEREREEWIKNNSAYIMWKIEILTYVRWIVSGSLK